jgi:hypothetical protein
METFESFLSLLSTIPDPRRAEGKRYGLPYILLFSVLAIVTGTNSYRGISYNQIILKRIEQPWKSTLDLGPRVNRDGSAVPLRQRG